MTHYYVVLDTDDDDNLIVKQTERTVALELFAEQDTLSMWDIEINQDQVTVYGAALDAVPTGENKEEIDNLILIALALRPIGAGLELDLIILPSPDVDEFRDSIGVNVVIPMTGIPICGIFVWGAYQADLKIYATSLLRMNAPLYIQVLQIAVEIADRLEKRRVKTLPAMRTALDEIAQSFDKAKLKVK